jgi:hypothetical protein
LICITHRKHKRTSMQHSCSAVRHLRTTNSRYDTQTYTHAQTHKDTQRHTEIHTSTHRHTETHRDTQRYTQAHPETQRHTRTQHRPPRTHPLVALHGQLAELPTRDTLLEMSLHDCRVAMALQLPPTRSQSLPDGAQPPERLDLAGGELLQRHEHAATQRR